MFQPCFLAVPIIVRITAKSAAPSSERKPPEIFCLSFIIRPSRSAWLLGVPWQGALFSLVKTQAGKLSLQPEALGAGQEATNGLKHFEKSLLLGGSGPCGPQRE